MKSVIEETYNANNFKQMQKSALKVYERFIATLTQEQIIMFEEVLDKLFELDAKITENGE